MTRFKPSPGGQRPWIRFAVRDTGCGIDPDTSATLFKPFVQADSSSARRYGGSGLGLALSLRLVESMGGSLGYASKPAEGSTFWFDIPLAHRAEAAAHGGRPAC